MSGAAMRWPDGVALRSRASSRPRSSSLSRSSQNEKLAATGALSLLPPTPKW
jgi:hypothetical protein